MSGIYFYLYSQSYTLVIAYAAVNFLICRCTIKLNIELVIYKKELLTKVYKEITFLSQTKLNMLLFVLFFCF